jgi:hypothetical protein
MIYIFADLRKEVSAMRNMFIVIGTEYDAVTSVSGF